MDEYADEFAQEEELLQRLCLVKFRDSLYETVSEYNRSGEFVRIFPSKNSKQYEKFFSGVYGTKVLNRMVQKALFSSEVLPYKDGRSEEEERKIEPKVTKSLSY
jgi:hypothetical protein